jgi:hypothetical protein
MAKTSRSWSVHEQTTAATSSRPARDKFDRDRAARALYNIDSDFSQANDLAAANPQKLRELQALWWVEVAQYTGSPIDFTCGLPFGFIRGARGRSAR